MERVILFVNRLIKFIEFFRKKSRFAVLNFIFVEILETSNILTMGRCEPIQCILRLKVLFIIAVIVAVVLEATIVIIEVFLILGTHIIVILIELLVVIIIIVVRIHIFLERGSL